MQAISELVSTRFIRHECLHLVCIICRYSAWFRSLCTHSASEELVECCWVAARSDSRKGVKLEVFVYKCANINLKLIVMEWWVMFFRCFFFFCDWTPQVEACDSMATFLIPMFAFIALNRRMGLFGHSIGVET